ncbi:hypothetical protein A2960_04940 [Candidatus Gottesmanbacteria bacterium RIFCSPLOWO2_01_FULL_39_12b]|uniref:Transport permease protein n=1 Tax=Candidatus Gottesmanbacteria bacterium RIFCSPLOWO2_01_FULL_39_12b TaxID=1798388 RepID=A0A1F6ANM9_9BACT|nr:MAG: hypothetical protein A2960_04940 [Candidatus Gottesmanbacteria bacterium RIFCSPLOWO2_01_FULL_39_12b]
MLLRHDLGKVIDTFYWPLIDIVTWGFLTVYISRNQNIQNNFILVLLSAIILWTLVYTVARDVAVCFLDDMWDRNVVNLYCSPLKPIEFLTASFLIALFRIILTLGVISITAYLFYSFNILILGAYLGLFFLILIVFSYTIGIFATTLILRFGPGVEIFAWSFPAILSPISAVFYPISVLPQFLQNIALLFPTSYVFGGMREILLTGTIVWQDMAIAALLDIIYLIIAFLLFFKVFNDVRKNGLIARFS